MLTLHAGAGVARTTSGLGAGRRVVCHPTVPRGGFGAARWLAFGVLFLGAAVGEASAAGLRTSAGPLSAMAILSAVLALHSWPPALATPTWLVGTLFAGALWLVGTRYRPGWAWLAARRGRVVAIDRPRTPLPALSNDHREEMLDAARRCFLNLQTAWDLGDVETLRAHTTPSMLEDLLQHLEMRGPGPNRTDVLTLDAVVLVDERVGARRVASVEFSGMIRESAEQGASPFREVWMLTCDDEAPSHWRLARQQALM